MVQLDWMITFNSEAPGLEGEELRVRRIAGHEHISEPYEFEVHFDVHQDGGLSPEVIAEMLSANASVSFGSGGYSRSGVLSEVSFVDEGADGLRYSYVAKLVPRVWLLQLTRRSRVFMDQSIPEIIESVLGEYSLSGDAVELRLAETYTSREYVVQYEETDFNFVSRWMEHLGIYYFFEDAGGEEKMVIADSRNQLVEAPDHASLVYSAQQQSHAGGFHDMRRRDKRIPAAVQVRDYNWRQPFKPVVGDAEIDSAIGVGLQSYYGAHAKTDQECATFARLRAERWKATRHRFSGRTTHGDLAPGARFSITGAGLPEFNQEYTIVEVGHVAEQSEAGGGASYHNEIESIAYSTEYRPPVRARWPRITGLMHARIDAEAVSSAAPINGEGLYRVVLPFDLYGAGGGRASRWIRKAEPYAGGEYGMHFTLHVGTEVLLAHQDGDPDRPIIVAAVPNPSASSPVRQDNATRSAIRTRSGILLDFEDDA